MTRSHQKHIGVEEGSQVWLTVSKGAITVAEKGGRPRRRAV